MFELERELDEVKRALVTAEKELCMLLSCTTLSALSERGKEGEREGKRGKEREREVRRES